MASDSTATAAAAAKHSDPTFRSYSSTQAATYASQRLSYPSLLYNAVLEYHAATGGQFSQLLDVGCGPGNATRDVAVSFDRALGVDPGEAMIAAARGKGGKTRDGGDVKYVVGAAEELGNVEGVGEGSVDLVIAAMAAHWFDMDKFWAQAAKVLKPGGTVALWTCSSAYCHPSTPNCDKVMHVLLELERSILAPYELVPNRLSRDMYDDLPLPWTIAQPVAAFPRDGFVRREWDRDGVLTNGETFFGGAHMTSVDTFMQMLGTASMVTRWREAHPHLVGTGDDVLTAFGARMREAMGPGMTSLDMGAGTVILMFKKGVDEKKEEKKN